MSDLMVVSIAILSHPRKGSNLALEDMDYFYGSSYFGLNAGEIKRVVSVLAYGYSKLEIQQKLLMAKALWRSHFQPDSVKTAVALTAPTSHTTLSGNTMITWNTSRPGGSASIWYSSDAGKTWYVVTPGTANSGNYTWNTALVPNAAFGMLRVIACDSAGAPYGFAESPTYFTLNNGGTSIPFIHILNEELEPGLVVDSDSLTLRYFAGSSGGDSLSVSLLYRTGAHEPFQQFDLYRIATDTLLQARNVVLRLLPNAEWFQIRAVVTVGSSTGSDSTSSFAKRTTREIVPMGNITFKGPSSVLPRIDVVDRSQLHDHLYTITFVDTASSGDKTFSVYDQTRGAYTVQNIPFKPARDIQIKRKAASIYRGRLFSCPCSHKWDFFLPADTRG